MHPRTIPVDRPTASKKRKRKTKGQVALEQTVEAFVKHQKEAEERFHKYEEERWKKETELEDRRRREDREHELQMMAMLAHMVQGRSAYTYTGPQSFNETDFDY